MGIRLFLLLESYLLFRLFYMSLKLDVLEFIRAGLTEQGSTTDALMPRLAQTILPTQAPIHWKAQGVLKVDDQRRQQDVLALSANATLSMTCTRCLEPIAVPLTLDRQFWVVKDEATAQLLDADQDQIDVLAASRQFDVMELLEDELLMALPVQPMHDQCALPAGKTGLTMTDEGKPNPFAVLAALKKTM
jgi:uncharacterized protein